MAGAANSEPEVVDAGKLNELECTLKLISFVIRGSMKLLFRVFPKSPDEQEQKQIGNKTGQQDKGTNYFTRERGSFRRGNKVNIMGDAGDNTGRSHGRNPDYNRQVL